MNKIFLRNDNFITSNYEFAEPIIREMRKTKPMTPDDEADAFHEYARSEGKKKEAIRDMIIKSNMKFMFSIAKTLTHDGEVLSELMNEGTIGMMEAIEKFDVTTGLRFMSYAAFYIKRNMVTYLRSCGLVSRHCDTTYVTQIYNEANRFYAENGRDASDSELHAIMSEKYGVDIKNYDDFHPITMAWIDGMSADDGEEGSGCGDIFLSCYGGYHSNGMTDSIEKEDIAYNVRKALEMLDDRERTIIQMTYGIDSEEYLSDDDICVVYNITPTRVKQIRNEALGKLKNYYKPAV